MSQRSRRILSYVSRAGMVLVFLLFSTILIASANGFLFDRQSMQFEETGIINLTVKQHPVTVTIGDRAKVYSSEVVRLAYLLPGNYTVSVTKAGFTTWTKDFDLNSGQVILNPFVILFPEVSEPKPATADQISTFQQAQKTTYQHPDMDIRGSEVWVRPLSRTYPFSVSADQFELIGRFRSPVLAARWFEGNNRTPTHVVFQIDREIRVMDRDGSNDITLVTLKSGDPAHFIVSDDNKTLIYQDGDSIFARPLQ